MMAPNVYNLTNPLLTKDVLACSYLIAKGDTLNSLATQFTSKHLNTYLNEVMCFKPFPEVQLLMGWAHEYIKNFYGILANYPYKEENIDEWFTVDINRDQDEDGGEVDHNVIKVKVMNTVLEKVLIPTFIDEKIKELPNELQGIIYYHGTNHKGAKSILEDGIKLRKRGRGGQDFGTDGFYLTDSSSYAVDWALAKFKKTEQRAVLMFKIESLGNDGLDLSSSQSKKDFDKVIKYYHGGKKGKSLKIDGSVVDKYSYIEGPMSRDGTKESPNAKQWCIKNDELASKFQFSGIIFF